VQDVMSTDWVIKMHQANKVGDLNFTPFMEKEE
jgi:hypothetical protein